MKCAREMAFANCRCGCQNHFVICPRITNYEVPAQDDDPMMPLSKTEAHEMALAERLERHEKRTQKRIQKRKQKLGL